MVRKLILKLGASSFRRVRAERILVANETLTPGFSCSRTSANTGSPVSVIPMLTTPGILGCSSRASNLPSSVSRLSSGVLAVF